MTESWVLIPFAIVLAPLIVSAIQHVRRRREIMKAWRPKGEWRNP